MDFLVASKYGEWEEAGSRARCRVYWKSLDEWAGMIYDFASIAFAKQYCVPVFSNARATPCRRPASRT